MGKEISVFIAGHYTDSMNMSLSKLQEVVKDREAWRAAVHRVQESDTTEGLNNNKTLLCSFLKTPELPEGLQQSIFRGR